MPEIPVNQQDFRFFIGRNLISIFGSQFQIWNENWRKNDAKYKKWRKIGAKIGAEMAWLLEGKTRHNKPTSLMTLWSSANNLPYSHFLVVLRTLLYQHRKITQKILKKNTTRAKNNVFYLLFNNFSSVISKYMHLQGLSIVTWRGCVTSKMTHPLIP